MRAEVWRGVARDGKACFRAHPILFLIAGAALGVLIGSRRRRPPAPEQPKRRRGILRFLELAAYWIGPALQVAGWGRREEAVTSRDAETLQN